MIFVTVGTQPQPFDRLFSELSRLVEDGTISDSIVIQSGPNSFKITKDNIRVKAYFSPEEMDAMIRSADCLITHGGIGTILTALKYGKKVIAVARLAKYGEHMNDHQVQILTQFGQDGYLMPVFEIEHLKDRILSLDRFVPNKYVSKNEEFVLSIKEAIDSF